VSFCARRRSPVSVRANSREDYAGKVPDPLLHMLLAALPALCNNAKNVSGFGGIDPIPLAFPTTSGNSGRATDNGWPGVENPIH